MNEDFKKLIEKTYAKDDEALKEARFHLRIADLLEQESSLPEEWVYLSFAKPGQWLGAIITKAHGPTHALLNINSLGINPGGEVMFFAIPDIQGKPTEEAIGDNANKLLSLEDCKKLLGPMVNQRGEEK